MQYKQKSIEERDGAVERLRQFLRLNMTDAEAARSIGVRAKTLYSWIADESKPASPERIEAFLDSMPAERSGIMPTGYEYREYKNWRGIPNPRRCPFCKRAKGEIRKARIVALPDRGGRASTRRSGRGMDVETAKPSWPGSPDLP